MSVFPNSCLVKHIFHYTSHSLKCTLLTYTNIFGLTLEQNELLGYHVVKGHSSALNYSRDALASPIRSMMTMLDAVQRGTFRPLALRGSQFLSTEEAVNARKQFESCIGLNVKEASRIFHGDSSLRSFERQEEFESKLALLREAEFLPVGYSLCQEGDGNRQPG